jgi:hypothetical protein
LKGTRNKQNNIIASGQHIRNVSLNLTNVCRALQLR